MTRQKEKRTGGEKRGKKKRKKREIGKGNQMTTLRFQTTEWTSDIPGRPSGA